MARLLTPGRRLDQLAPDPGGGPGRFGLALRTVVALAGLACLLAALYASTQAPERSIQMDAHDWQTLGVLLVSYGLVTVALSRSRAPAARSAHQVALIAGLGLGLLMVVGSSPASPIGNLNMGGGPTVSPLGYATPLCGCLVIAAAVAWWHRQTSVGVTASVLTALVAGLVFCAGLLTVTYAATSWLTADPATIASWQVTWSARHYGEYRHHYDDIATYLIRENGDSAGTCLLIGPLLGLVFGIVGATLGRRAPGAHAGAAEPHRPRIPGWLRWLATAGGLGAWRVYPYGMALAVELTLVPAIGPDTVDGGAMTWFLLVASGSAASLGLMAGFAVARTTGRIGRGVLVGGLTPLIGVTLADLGLGLG